IPGDRGFRYRTLPLRGLMAICFSGGGSPQRQQTMLRCFEAGGGLRHGALANLFAQSYLLSVTMDLLVRGCLAPEIRAGLCAFRCFQVLSSRFESLEAVFSRRCCADFLSSLNTPLSGVHVSDFCVGQTP